MHQLQHYSDVIECSTIAIHDAYVAVWVDGIHGIEHLIHQRRKFWLHFVDMLYSIPYDAKYIYIYILI